MKLPQNSVTQSVSRQFAIAAMITGLALANAVATLQADISLPKIFTDQMVLQRETDINVWGTADAGEQLTITLGENSATVTAGQDGKWATKITAPPAGGPYELTIAGTESRVVFKDVLVGEVWICSGQSNMQWPLVNSLAIEDEAELEQFIAAILDSRLRLFTVPANPAEKPVEDFSQASMWQECTPETVREFSAMAYFFAKQLRENEKLVEMPIGLIDVSWGGTACESWTSEEALESEESLAPMLAHWRERAEAGGPHRPASLFNGMIAPLIPMSVRGVIWYQGESNVGRGRQYATLFPTMIRDWRSRFGQGDFPFYFVQLAPFRYAQQAPQQLAEIWEAQQKTLSLPNTAMAASVDLGNSTDIHPKNKQEVARRLALAARARDYGEENLTYSGPVFDSHEWSQDRTKIIIRLKHAKGLHCTSDELTGFTICGEDHEFVTAKAEIREDVVIVWCDEIKLPQQVRYLWNDSASATLVNEAGLPASPFRTDEFPLLSQDRDY